jgi:phosphatidylinositol glycan class A protein
MAILEAACCNLLVVSTNVGGVPEVLPDRMVYLSAPSCEELNSKLCQAIEDVPYVDTSDFYDELKNIYSWEEVARKTVKVYDSTVNMPFPNMLSRIKHAFGLGAVVWILTYCYLHMEYVVLFLIDKLWPAEDIDILPDFDSERYKE